MMGADLLLMLHRGNFLKNAAAFAFAPALAGAARRVSGTAAREKILAYAGTYTNEDVEGNGECIDLFGMEERTGELLNLTLVARTPNPTWITIHWNSSRRNIPLTSRL